MATYNKFQPMVASLANGVFNFATDQLMVALTATANAPVNTNSVLANLTEISYTNLSSRVITTTSSTQTAGVYSLVLVDLTLTASGTVATFRYVVIYDNTAASKNLICYFDYGSDLTLNTGESLLIDFSPANTLFTIT